ncbi:endonuclease domain-containing protein [Mesorhizobium sp. CA16]|uniref:endonuclease domain-containing protein n=1 Tax=Mesorhizobium sp. CA16 TaxID=588496 RepID=UPI001CCED33F|nr:endonuclease domain-containing protein [Mesorhizobium sp. CA16]MBZ9916045.1 endonuclease domain-containing protein [Mesorhizobium sp. CA16]
MPHQPVTPAKRNFARSMRREPTEAEDRLWHELRGRRLDNIKFRRQVPIGRFVADFLCAEAKLVVEIDGSQQMRSAIPL